MDVNFTLTRKQNEFIGSTADEVLYGGAAGGGKSYGQLIDAFLYALKYPGSKQLILRRTFPELERSLILVSLTIYPKEICKYKGTTHRWEFKNKSFIEFGYCDSEKDVAKYQGAEFDVIRFDELTHFTEYQYTYLISRIRGVNNFPKQIKCSTNPGGVGHAWVKAKFIDNKEPMKEYTDDLNRKSIFIPAKVQENKFLMESDPLYVKRLEQLPEKDRKALLEGEWDIFEGQYFTEFRKDIHVIQPFIIPEHWDRYVTLDYGLDMLACYWIAIDEQNKAYVYKELYESGLIISDAAKKILEVNDKDNIKLFYAPPDLWNKRQETGKSAAEIFYNNGVLLKKSKNDRVNGWYAVKEWLKPYESIDTHTGKGLITADLKIFANCKNLIRTLPQLQIDGRNPNDVANEPHELTHGPDAIRGFCGMRTAPTKIAKEDSDKITPEQKHNKMIKQMTGGKINSEMFKWG